MSSSLQNVTNESCSFSREIPLTEKAAKTTAYAMLMLVSLVGNFLVMAIVSGTREMWTTTNLLIANMAASDFMMSLCAPPRIIVEIFSDSRWLMEGTFGLLLCKLVYFFQDVSTAISIQSLVVISVNRFCAIVFPYRAPLINTKFCCKVVIPAIWLVGCAIHSVYLYVVKLYKVDDRTYCGFRWESAFDNKKTEEVYYIVVLVLLIILPLLIVIILHCVMIAELCKSKATESRSLWNQRRQRENNEVTRKILVFTLAFVICIIPINVGAILFYFVWDRVAPCGIDADMMFFVMRFILFSNAFINPCLYFVLYTRYQRGLKDVSKRLRRVLLSKRTKPTRENGQRRDVEDAV